MSQHSFAESATITHLSHSIPSLSAGMSVKDKLSDYLTEIKFHTTPSSLKNSLNKIKLIYIYNDQENHYLYKVHFHRKSNVCTLTSQLC